MKKLISTLSVITLSLMLLTSSALSATTNTINQIILHVQSSTLDHYSNLYIAEVLDENGDLYTIQSYDNISNKWLDATITDQGEITDYKILD